MDNVNDTSIPYNFVERRQLLPLAFVMVVFIQKANTISTQNATGAILSSI